ncbi:MAG: DnaD domain protein [Thermomicrobiales bacterium]|nr:DnaD domain protein [Thermomicrobiales bacterium]
MPSDQAGGFDSSIPAQILAKLISDVWNPLDVKIVLGVATLGGTTELVAEAALLADASLNHGSRADGSDRPVSERLLEALERVVARGLVLRLVDEASIHWLLLGTDENQRLARVPERIYPGERAPWKGKLVLERPTIFGLYEQNIGLVTPIIADRLVDALERYPEEWVESAIEEAVSYNRRNWRYIERILENWATEGRIDEADRGSAQRDLNREKHLRGKYSHIFRRGGLPDL